MSSHITRAYLNNAIGTSVASAVASTSVWEQWIQAGSALVDTGLVNAGYDVPTTANDTVKLATLGAVLPMAMSARSGLQIPTQLLELATGLFRSIATGEVQIPGMTPTTRTAVGGVSFSDSDPDSTTGRPAIFNGKLSKVF